MENQFNPTLNPVVLSAPIQGVNLTESTLGACLQDRSTLLVFLRHLGCLFCKELVTDLRTHTESHPEFPPILFFYQGTPQQGEAFFRKNWPQAQAVADRTKYFYHKFGVERGSLGQIFSPEAISCGIRATMKGHIAGRIVGDPWMMPGMFLARDQEILWQHDFRHAGDHPDLEKLNRELVPLTL